MMHPGAVEELRDVALFLRGAIRDIKSAIDFEPSLSAKLEPHLATLEKIAEELDIYPQKEQDHEKAKV